uniref:Major intrinsically disordered Notch2-binding receptor 1-like C-terminal domain-containing protein n=1 Tax=Sphaeramia orbicularis TaxID=375764 RepID=A0A673CQ44_9TELE
MDISALPNNNHPEKFLQLDVGMLPVTHGMFQVGAVMSSHKHWHNRVYFQVTAGSHLSYCTSICVNLLRPSNALLSSSNIKTNPLYMDIRAMDAVDNEKFKPSWTVQEYDTQTIHGNLADYLKKTPKDLDFWLEDLYTPGFDSLLRKKERNGGRTNCHIVSVLSVVKQVMVSPLLG